MQLETLCLIGLIFIISHSNSNRSPVCTIGRFLIVWFNDWQCVLGKSGQITNPIITIVNPILKFQDYTWSGILRVAVKGCKY